MMAHDVFAPYGGRTGATVARVRTRMLVVVSSSDHVVNPAPSLAFAKALGAPTLVLTDGAGHQGSVEDERRVAEAAARFLDAP